VAEWLAWLLGAAYAITALIAAVETGARTPTRSVGWMLPLSLLAGVAWPVTVVLHGYVWLVEQRAWAIRKKAAREEQKRREAARR